MADERLFRELDGKYRILAQLGEGGTARVWLAVAKGPSGFNKLVVLKTIRKELLGNQEIVTMFLDEARLAARLNHPNIVQTNQVFEQAGHPVIVMEYLDGLPFSAVLERQRDGDAMPLAMLLRIVSDSLSGLHTAHTLSDYDGSSLSVVHRDVSPHNLFITFAGQVKVLDFGIALLPNTKEVSETGSFKGKLRYMPPEQVLGERVDPRADLYSLGVILWEIATAQRMWPSTAQEATIMRRILAHEIPDLDEAAPGIDAELSRIIQQALSGNPNDRYQTALELQSDLDDYISTLGGTIRNRDVGRTLSKMFSDVREERATTIETQLSRQPALVKEIARPGHLPELTSFSGSRGSSIPAEKTSATRLLTALGVLLALLMVSIGLFWPNTPSDLAFDSIETSQAAPESEQPSTQKTAALVPSEKKSKLSPSEKSPNRVELRITAFPRHARIYIDSVAVKQNPYSATHPLDESKRHRLEISAPGYQKSSKEITFDRDLEMVLTLRRLRQAPKAVKSKQPEPAPEAVQAPALGPALKSCSPPYFYDERGVKKYKPECL